MAKTLKELAFLRDLYVDSEWTQVFTDFADKHLGFKKDQRFLYYNAGTGNHVLALRKKMGKKASVAAFCEDREVMKIANAKAKAIQSDIEFSDGDFDDESFEAVMADASFVRPESLRESISEIAGFAAPGAAVAFFTPSAGSFGEIFSLLWEVFFNEEIGDGGAAVERLITEIPTVSDIEAIAEDAGITELTSHTQVETFDYKDAKQFIEAPLIADFLMPVWLRSLSAKDQKKALSRLVKLIEAEDGELTFRFTVKATLVIGEKK